MSNIKIVSDGTPNGTKVYAPSGEPLESKISKIIWSINPQGVAMARITFLHVELNVIGKQKVAP